MYYLLKISNKAFVKIEDNLTIVQNYEDATKIERIGDAMKHAAQINKEWEANVVQVVGVG